MVEGVFQHPVRAVAHGFTLRNTVDRDGLRRAKLSWPVGDYERLLDALARSRQSYGGAHSVD